MPREKDAERRFRGVYEESHQRIIGYFLRRLPRRDAFDAAEEVFLVAWRRIDDMPDGAEALPWLFGISHNVLRNMQRSERRRIRLAARLINEPARPAPRPSDEVIDQSEQEALLTALDELSWNDREVLRLAYWDELPHAQIGVILDCTAGAVDVRVHRAIRRLGKALERSGHMPHGRPASLPNGKEEG